MSNEGWSRRFDVPIVGAGIARRWQIAVSMAVALKQSTKTIILRLPISRSGQRRVAQNGISLTARQSTARERRKKLMMRSLLPRRPQRPTTPE
jgi:aspartate oxidase